jgi:hypothetical protein
MKDRDTEPAAAEGGKETFTQMSSDTISRREFLAGQEGRTTHYPGR